MKTNYQVNTPSEFIDVINDILLWYKEAGQNNLVIALQGDLGAGKTTFTQQLAKYLEIEEVVNSPTFTIMKQYDLSHPQFETLIHIDAYRLESDLETKPLYFEEIFKQPQVIVCVEWPEIIANILPKNAVWVKIEIGEGEVRLVTTKVVNIEG